MPRAVLQARASVQHCGALRGAQCGSRFHLDRDDSPRRCIAHGNTLVMDLPSLDILYINGDKFSIQSSANTSLYRASTARG